MKVNAQQVKTAGIKAGMATVGFTAGHLANQFAPDSVQKFVAPGTALLGLGLAVVAKQAAVQSFGVGMAIHGTIKTVNNFTAPSVDAEGNEIAATGVKAMIANYVPSLSGVEGYTGSYGYGMGNIEEYPSYEETPLLMGFEEPQEQGTGEWM